MSFSLSLCMICVCVTSASTSYANELMTRHHHLQPHDASIFLSLAIAFMSIKAVYNSFLLIESGHGIHFSCVFVCVLACRHTQESLPPSLKTRD